MTTPVEDLKGDFKLYLRHVWPLIGLPQPTKVQLDMADFLQHGPKRKMLEAFRGVGKTWVTAAFITWLLYRDPNLKILVVSASKAHADNTTTFCLQIIKTVPALEALIPREDQREAKIQFDVGTCAPSRDPSVRSVGITGQIVGSRADIIIADDVETPTNSATQMMREKLRTGVEEFAAVLKPVDNTGIIYLGTPQCEDSLYRTLPKKGYTIRIWPARYPEPRVIEGYHGCLAPLIQRELDVNPMLLMKSTDSERFSEADLLEREAEFARSGFSLQFMLDTSVSDGTRYPLKLSDLIIMNLNAELAPPKVVWAASPELVDNELPNVGMAGDRLYRPMSLVEGQWAPYTGAVLAIDPSGRGKDETGYCVVKILHGQLYATAWGGLSGGYSPETLQTLAAVAKAQKVNQVVVESNFGDGMFTQLLKPVLAKLYPVTVEEVRHSIQKEKRIIDTLEPVLNQHRLILDRRIVLEDSKPIPGVPPEHVQSYSGLYQLTRITRDRGALRHDDRLDALAIAVNYWVEQMNRDTDQAVADHNEAWLNSQVNAFVSLWEDVDAKVRKHEKTWIN